MSQKGMRQPCQDLVLNAADKQTKAREDGGGDGDVANLYRGQRTL